METNSAKQVTKFSIVIPCYNEQKTLRKCVEKVLGIADDNLKLEIIIVDDCSVDQSLSIAEDLKKTHPEIVLLRHEKNKGKGAALKTGFSRATGQFVAVQDADLEYNPTEFKILLEPLISDEADVVLGSRFLSTGKHRVFYFWHFMGNRFLTFLSNMFTDLNLTDMETCYKVFKTDVLKKIDIKEKRFGFEPEIVAKVAHMRLRIFEIGISYSGRTYDEGKKIGAKDGFRAIYCIFRYNVHKAPVPVQFLLYVLVGGIAAFANVMIFLGMLEIGTGVNMAACIAYVCAATINYLLCITLLFRHNAKWGTFGEVLIFFLLVSTVGFLDLLITKFCISFGFRPSFSKILASAVGLAFNFLGRRFFVFPEPSSGPWKT